MKSWLIILTVAVFAIAPPLIAETEAGGDALSASQRILNYIDLIIEHHIDPPTRQEMVLAVSKLLYHDMDVDPPQGLARWISKLRAEEDYEGFLTQHWRQAAASVAAKGEGWQERVVDSALSKSQPHPGLHTRILSEEDYQLQKQFSDNRYVGIGIQTSTRRRYPCATRVLPLGPAAVAGMKHGDLMTTINGQDMFDVEIPEVIKMLRGQEGVPVTITVRQPNEIESASRTLTFKRGVAPQVSVLGWSQDENETWDPLIEQDIAYAKLRAITGSTLHELRQIENQLESKGIRSLILDLRGTSSVDVHHVITLANGLIDGGKIGMIVHVRGRRNYTADRDCVFRDWKIVCLINESANGLAEWFASALQANGRALLFGRPPAGQTLIMGDIKLPDGMRLQVPTSRWEPHIPLVYGTLYGLLRPSPQDNHDPKSFRLEVDLRVVTDDAEEALGVARHFPPMMFPEPNEVDDYVSAALGYFREKW